MDFRYTKHQVPRGTKPDAILGNKIYLIKNVSILHATYQIRLSAYMAHTQNKKLVLKIPKGCKLGVSLSNLIKENKKLILVERM